MEDKIDGQEDAYGRDGSDDDRDTAYEDSPLADCNAEKDHDAASDHAVSDNYKINQH